MAALHETRISEPALEQVRVRVLPDGRMTREDAASYLGMRPKTLAMWALEGKGPPAHRVMGRVFYYKNDLDDLIRGGPKSPTPEPQPAAA